LSDLLTLDATAQIQALATRRVSAVELLEMTVRRHEEVHGEINAVVAVDLERARPRARAIDEQRVKGEHLGALAGLPMTIKDCLDVEGMPASSGLKDLRNRIVKDAAAVVRAKHEGAVIWGKTNVPVMTADWQSFNALYGTTNNPWALDRTCGGSSGGAAAALAARVTALEIGSDIGGSLRVPASFCGVYAHKPTFGLVSQRGHVPPAPGSFAERDLNVVGPMARSARDLRLLLSVLEEGPLAAKTTPPDIKEMRLGLWLEEPDFPLDPQVKATIQNFVGALSGHVAMVEPVRPVDASALIDAYRVLLASVMAADLPARARASMIAMRGPAKVMMRLGLGRDSAEQILAYTATHAEWLIADEVRARLGARVRALFERYDAIIAPITPVTAFPHDHQPLTRRTLALSDGGKIPYLSMLNWIAMATALGLPATAIPAGQAADGLPVGVQIIGPRGGDGRTLTVAQAIEDDWGGFQAPPAEAD
jgi:amidase